MTVEAESTQTNENKDQDKPKKHGLKRWLKRIGIGLVTVIVVVGGGGGIYAYTLTSAYDASMEKVYAVPIPSITRSTDPAVIARGKHLAESIAACTTNGCHTADMGGGRKEDAGPIGIMVTPNASTILPAYSDGELARLMRHGIKKDGRTVRFMPMNENNWLPDSDVVAVISYLRTLPPVDRTTGTSVIKPLGKILDRKGLIPIDTARRIDHDHIEIAPPATPTAEYGRFIGRMCNGCHGEHMSGGPIPGAPSDFPVPLNLTPHETGLKGWTYEDFDQLTKTGVRKNGKKLADFMPIDALGHLDDVEKHALWAYLQSLPPQAFGGR